MLQIRTHAELKSISLGRFKYCYERSKKMNEESCDKEEEKKMNCYEEVQEKKDNEQGSLDKEEVKSKEKHCLGLTEKMMI
ncbi:hypothetical protein Tco_0920489 [Tanacetum coccineum]